MRDQLIDLAVEKAKNIIRLVDERAKYYPEDIIPIAKALVVLASDFETLDGNFDMVFKDYSNLQNWCIKKMFTIQEAAVLINIMRNGSEVDLMEATEKAEEWLDKNWTK